MADASGPCSTLPGSSRKAPDGLMCDHHSDRPATRRVQGETDSFGAEYHDMCDECYTAHRRLLDEERQQKQFCEGCSSEQKDVRPVRDPDEGQAGPVYYRCAACRKRMFDAFAESCDYGDDYDSRSDDSDYDSDPMPEPPLQEDESEIEGPSVDDDRPAGHPTAYVDGQYIFRR